MFTSISGSRKLKVDVDVFSNISQKFRSKDWVTSKPRLTNPTLTYSNHFKLAA